MFDNESEDAMLEFAYEWARSKLKIATDSPCLPEEIELAMTWIHFNKDELLLWFDQHDLKSEEDKLLFRIKFL